MTLGGGITTGIAAAIGASLLLSTGSIIQAADVRRVHPRHGMRLSLMGRLLRRPRWIGGTLIGALAFPCEILALAHAPIVIVQPLHAVGLVLLLLAGVRVLGERPRGLDLVGVAAIVAGVAVVAWGAPGGREAPVSFVTLGAAVAGLLALAVAPYVAAERCGRHGPVVSAALAFAANNLAMKGMTNRISAHQWGLAAVYLTAVGVCTIVAVLSQMTAFQRRRAVEVVPITFAVPTFLPVVVGLAVLHERWGSAILGGAVFAGGALLLLIGSLVVASSRAVIGVSERAAAAPPP